MTADLTRAQLDILADCRDLGHFPGDTGTDGATLQALDLVDDYGAVTPLGAMLLARWQPRPTTGGQS